MNSHSAETLIHEEFTKTIFFEYYKTPVKQGGTKGLLCASRHNQSDNVINNGNNSN